MNELKNFKDKSQRDKEKLRRQDKQENEFDCRKIFLKKVKKKKNRMTDESIQKCGGRGGENENERSGKSKLS